MAKNDILWMFIIGGVILAVVLSTIEKQEIVEIKKGIEFAGYTWDIILDGQLQNNYGSAGGRYSMDENGFINLESYAGQESSNMAYPNTAELCFITENDISDIDEFLIILSGDGTGNSRIGGGGSGGSYLYIYIIDDTGKKQLKGEGCSASSPDGGQCFYDIEPQLIKFMNNFDGTYTSFTTLGGIGDVFIKDRTIETTGMVKLAICSYSGAAGRSAYGKGSATIYNIVTKRLEAPVCKADEILTPNGTCNDIESILLARESAIYESLEEKLARIEERLQQREEGLQKQIEDLKQLLDTGNNQEQIDLLSQKLEELNKQLQLTNESADIILLKDQISFYENRLDIIEQKSGERLDYLNSELGLTKQILDSIQNKELIPPPDVDIEEIIKKVIDRVDIQVTEVERELTEEEIQALINQEIKKAFEEINPPELQIVKEPVKIPMWIKIIGIIILIGIVFKLFRQ